MKEYCVYYVDTYGDEEQARYFFGLVDALAEYEKRLADAACRDDLATPDDLDGEDPITKNVDLFGQFVRAAKVWTTREWTIWNDESRTKRDTESYFILLKEIETTSGE